MYKESSHKYFFHISFFSCWSSMSKNNVCSINLTSLTMIFAKHYRNYRNALLFHWFAECNIMWTVLEEMFLQSRIIGRLNVAIFIYHSGQLKQYIRVRSKMHHGGNYVLNQFGFSSRKSNEVEVCFISLRKSSTFSQIRLLFHLQKLEFAFFLCE